MEWSWLKSLGRGLGLVREPQPDPRADQRSELITYSRTLARVIDTRYSLLAGLAGDTRATVNSLHGQGVRRLGEGLVVEAQAPDGLVEAFRHDGPAFMLAVQWHPEWKVRENAFYLATFRAFGDACRARAARRPA